MTMPAVFVQATNVHATALLSLADHAEDAPIADRMVEMAVSRNGPNLSASQFGTVRPTTDAAFKIASARRRQRHGRAMQDAL